MNHEYFMRRAIELSHTHMQRGDGGPFGAVIVKDNKIVAEGWNCVTSTNDPTAHAEMTAIRRACQEIGDFSLAGHTIYTSCEPCPMCLSAIYWSRMEKIYYANSKEDAAKIDMDDSYIYQEIAKDISRRSIPAERLLEDEAWKVFQAWSEKVDRISY